MALVLAAAVAACSRPAWRRPRGWSTFTARRRRPGAVVGLDAVGRADGGVEVDVGVAARRCRRRRRWRGRRSRPRATSDEHGGDRVADDQPLALAALRPRLSARCAPGAALPLFFPASAIGRPRSLVGAAAQGRGVAADALPRPRGAQRAQHRPRRRRPVERVEVDARRARRSAARRTAGRRRRRPARTRARGRRRPPRRPLPAAPGSRRRRARRSASSGRSWRPGSPRPGSAPRSPAPAPPARSRSRPGCRRRAG